MIICGIDPGPKTSGLCVWDTENQIILAHDAQSDNRLIKDIAEFEREVKTYVIEDIEYRNRKVGSPVFDTCKTIGRLQERLGMSNIAMYRKSAVSNHFRGLQLLKQRYPAGSKKTPGITYNLVAHSWDAFALCIFHQDKEIGL